MTSTRIASNHKNTGNNSIDFSRGMVNRKRFKTEKTDVKRTSSKKMVGKTFTARRQKDSATYMSSSQTSRRDQQGLGKVPGTKTGGALKSKNRVTSHSNMSLNEQELRQGTSSSKRTGFKSRLGRTNGTKKPAEKGKIYNSLHSLERKKKSKRRSGTESTSAALRKGQAASDRNTRVNSRKRKVTSQTPSRLVSKTYSKNPSKPATEKHTLKSSSIHEDEGISIDEARDARKSQNRDAEHPKLSDYVTQVQPGLGPLGNVEMGRRGAVRQKDSPNSLNAPQDTGIDGDNRPSQRKSAQSSSKTSIANLQNKIKVILTQNFSIVMVISIAIFI